MKSPVWLLVFLFWALLTVVYLTQLSMLPRPPGESFAALVRGLMWQAVYYLTWAPLTLAIWRLTRSWEVEALGARRFLLRHVGLAVPLTISHSLLVVGISTVLFGRPATNPWPTFLLTYVRARTHTQLLIYAAVVGTGLAIRFHSRYRERQIAAAQLETQLVHARLDSLRAQLQPHFLFNSLHSIASLARAGDNAGVVRLIGGLSDLLRHLLDTRTSHHQLRQEMELVERYLDIQRVRFGDRLRVSMDVPPEAADATVPLLIVQPLVENALRHGLMPRVEPGTLSIQAVRNEEALIIDVADDGVGLPPGWSPAAASGTGLQNLSSRLAAEFGSRASVNLAPRTNGGTIASVRLPYVAS